MCEFRSETDIYMMCEKKTNVSQENKFRKIRIKYGIGRKVEKLKSNHFEIVIFIVAER